MATLYRWLRTAQSDVLPFWRRTLAFQEGLRIGSETDVPEGLYKKLTPIMADPNRRRRAGS